MARYEFGGGFAELVVSPDAALGGALKAAPGTTLPPLYNKPVYDGTRVIVTDFLIDNGAGVLSTPTSSLVTDAAGYPPRFLGPDGLAILYDLAGHGYYPHDAGAEVPLGDETKPGLVEFATSVETLAAAATNRAVHPAGLEAKVAQHDSDTGSHQDIRDQTDGNTVAMQAKADLVGGVVPVAQINGSASATPDAIVKYTPTGAVVLADGLNGNEGVSRLQMETALINSAVVGADVRSLPISTGLPISVPTPATSFVTIPDMSIIDASSGQVWECEYSLKYRALAAAGFQVRFKQNTSAATNKLSNPEAAANTNNWVVGPAFALGRGTSGTTPPVGGASYFTMTALTATTTQIWNTDLAPAAPGSVWTAAAYFMTQVGTPRSCRVDIQFFDPAGTTAVQTILGTPAATNGTTYTRISSPNSGTTGSVAPLGTGFVRFRAAVITPAVGDVVRMGAAQMEPSAPLPTYGTTGGGGASALIVDGEWRGLTAAATTADNYSHVDSIRYPAVAGLTGTVGGLGSGTDATVRGTFRVTVGGTGLTNQRIELEAAQAVSNGTADTIQAGRATFAKVVG